MILAAAGVNPQTIGVGQDMPRRLGNEPEQCSAPRCRQHRRTAPAPPVTVAGGAPGAGDRPRPATPVPPPVPVGSVVSRDVLQKTICARIFAPFCVTVRGPILGPFRPCGWAGGD